MDLLATEGPILLGYAALAAILGILALIVVLADPATRARRARNRAARRARHIAAGCSVCATRADADVDAWLDYPTAGGPR